jgi:hypothetical protein
MRRWKPRRSADYWLAMAGGLVLVAVGFEFVAIMFDSGPSPIRTYHPTDGVIGVVLIGAGICLCRVAEKFPLVAPPRGRCPNCGYDLRATPESSGPLLHVCPECGARAPR